MVVLTQLDVVEHGLLPRIVGKGAGDDRYLCDVLLHFTRCLVELEIALIPPMAGEESDELARTRALGYASYNGHD